MKILVTGSTGLLGRALLGRLERSCDVAGLSRHAQPPASERGARHFVCDLLDARAVQALIATAQPDAVVHAQGLADVDRCELEPDQARAQNVTTTEHLVEALSGRPTWLVHVSTNYVFDGMKGSAYDETDAPRPASVYGRTKLEAEQVALRHPRGVVVRPSTLFGPGRRNFCDELAERLQAGSPVEAFVDQVICPTYTEDLADAIGELIGALQGWRDEAFPRLYHITNAGSCSRVAFAERLAALLGCREDLVIPIPMAHQQRPARRPANATLRTEVVARMIGRTLRPWDEALEAHLRQRRPFDSPPINQA